MAYCDPMARYATPGDAMTQQAGMAGTGLHGLPAAPIAATLASMVAPKPPWPVAGAVSGEARTTKERP
jgi:hypothetical protein